MNITILSLRGPTQNGIRGGAREYIQKMAHGLLEEGHNVTIICGAEPKQNLFKSEIVDGIKIIRVGKNRWSILAIRKYFNDNLRKDTDILIENIVSFPMFTTLFSRKLKHFTIIHHLTGRNYFKTHSISIATIGYFLEKISFRFFYKRSNFIAVSEHTKKSLITNGVHPDQIEIINPGIIDNFFVPGEKAKNPEIFYIGRYSAYGGNKKVDQLIESFKILSHEIKNAKLIIAGKGEGIEVLKKQAKGYNIEFVGMINDEEKRNYMQRAWIFASPSLAEGFGITWIEANACGTPVVGYKLEELNTVNENNSIMVKKEDILALSESLIFLCSDIENVTNMYEACIKNGEKYVWSKSIKKFIQYIEKHLG